MSDEKYVDQVFERRRRYGNVDEFVERQTRRGYTGAMQTVSSVPMEPPIGYERRPSIFEQMKAMVDLKVNQLREQMENGDEFESLEEADDFEVGDADDFHPSTPYEGNFDVSIKELLAAGAASLKAKKEAADDKARPRARAAPDGDAKPGVDSAEGAKPRSAKKPDQGEMD